MTDGDTSGTFETCDPAIEECEQEDQDIMSTVGSSTLEWLTIIYSFQMVTLPLLGIIFLPWKSKLISLFAW